MSHTITIRQTFHSGDLPEDWLEETGRLNGFGEAEDFEVELEIESEYFPYRPATRRGPAEGNEFELNRASIVTPDDELPGWLVAALDPAPPPKSGPFAPPAYRPAPDAWIDHWDEEIEFYLEGAAVDQREAADERRLQQWRDDRLTSSSGGR